MPSGLGKLPLGSHRSSLRCVVPLPSEAEHEVGNHRPAESLAMPGVLADGATLADAISRVWARGLRALAGAEQPGSF